MCHIETPSVNMNTISNWLLEVGGWTGGSWEVVEAREELGQEVTEGGGEGHKWGGRIEGGLGGRGGLQAVDGA